MLNKIKIMPSILQGKIKIPPSKSLTHRYLIASSFSEKTNIIKNVFKSVDIITTIEVLKKLGVKFIEKKISKYISNFIISGYNNVYDFNILKEEIFNCKESGSTLRFIIPLLLTIGGKINIIGEGKLIERPLNVYYDIFKNKNIKYFNNNGKLPLTIKGKLKGGNFYLKGDISSQFITGLLFVLPLLNEDSFIKIITKLESKPYVALTLNVLDFFGIKVDFFENDMIFKIKGKQKYKSKNISIEGDYSQLAFFAVAGIIGKKTIICEGLNKKSIQGDKIIIDVIKSMGGNVEIKKNSLIFHPSITHGININVSECPDLLPAITLLASLSKGKTIITGAKRLKLKESNRLKAITTELKKLGANIFLKNNSLLIKGVEIFKGGVNLKSWNDHRIAMTLAISANNIKNPIFLEGYNSVYKSYPSFWEDFKSIGGIINE